MAQITLKVVNAVGEVVASSSAMDEVNLVYAAEYQEGDKLVVEFDEVNTYYHLQLDDAKGDSFVYVTGDVEFTIPFGEKRKNISPLVFAGALHYMYCRKAYADEVNNYRNLELNVWDQHGEVNCYPHASANVETRGESTFAALNAIDDVTASESHGMWPYESWGINRRDDATWKLEFGRPIDMDKLVVYTRADFPHDNWWVEMKVTFSDGTTEVLPLVKGGEPQRFDIVKKGITWLELSDLIKADDPSPFPALSQLMVYGRG